MCNSSLFTRVHKCERTRQMISRRLYGCGLSIFDPTIDLYIFRSHQLTICKYKRSVISESKKHD